MSHITKRIKRAFLYGKERGVAAVEFALMMPVWILLFLGVSDGAFYLLMCEKIDRIAYSVTDIVTQYKVVTLADLNDISLAASQLMQPFSFSSGEGVLIVSSVYQAVGDQPRIMWQYSYPQGQAFQSSKLGSIGAVAALPSGLIMNDNENVIISEVYYHYDPLFIVAGIFGSSTVYRYAVYKPRLSPLITSPK